MRTNLFIPSKIRVGFQQRKDTFTSLLAYIIYYDEKGKIRKESSWSSWCKSELGVLELDNIPQDGFILNKGVQRSRDWGSGRSVIRVYDPRNFEFEIDVDNLIGILMHSDVSKRDIVEKCVYAWTGGNLILLPVNSIAYQESVLYTKKQSLKVSAKDLIPGVQYAKKKSDGLLTYIGYYDWWEWQPEYTESMCYYGASHFCKGKKHIFYEDGVLGDSFITPSISTLSNAVTVAPDENFAFLVDKFFNTSNSQPVKAVTIDTQLMQQKYTDNPTRYYTFPEFCRVVDDVLYVITTNHYYARFDHFNGLQYKSIPLRIIIDKSITLKNRLYAMPTALQWNRSKYTNVDDVCDDVTSKLKKQINEVVINKEYSEISSVDQYIEVMQELGYGVCKLVLANGNEIEHKL